MISVEELVEPRMMEIDGVDADYGVRYDVGNRCFNILKGDLQTDASYRYEVVFSLADEIISELRRCPVKTRHEYSVFGVVVSRDEQEHTVTINGFSVGREEARLIDYRRVAGVWIGSSVGTVSNAGRVVLFSLTGRLICELSAEEFGHLSAYLMRITEPTPDRGYMWPEGPYGAASIGEKTGEL